MIIKKCCHCKIEKQVHDFYKNKSTPAGLSHECKSCTNTRQLKYRQKYKKSIQKTKKEYAKNNRQKIKAYQKNYYLNNKERLSKYKKEWGKINSEKIKLRSKIYREKNKVILSDKSKIYRTNNHEQIRFKQNLYKKFAVEELRDSYIKQLIARTTNISYKQIPNCLIRLKMEELRTKRLIKEIAKC